MDASSSPGTVGTARPLRPYIRHGFGGSWAAPASGVRRLPKLSRESPRSSGRQSVIWCRLLPHVARGVECHINISCTGDEGDPPGDRANQCQSTSGSACITHLNKRQARSHPAPPQLAPEPPIQAYLPHLGRAASAKPTLLKNTSRETNGRDCKYGITMADSIPARRLMHRCIL